MFLQEMYDGKGPDSIFNGNSLLHIYPLQAQCIFRQISHFFLNFL